MHESYLHTLSLSLAAFSSRARERDDVQHGYYSEGEGPWD